MSFENLFSSVAQSLNGVTPTETSQDTTEQDTVQESTQETLEQDTTVSQDTPSVEQAPPRQEFRQETTQPQQRPEEDLINGRYTPEQFEQINEQWCSFFEFNPFQAVLQGLQQGFQVRLDENQQAFLNEKYQEWHDQSPIEAQMWANKISFLENQSAMESEQKAKLEAFEKTQEIINEAHQAKEAIAQEMPIFQDEAFASKLNQLANMLAVSDMDAQEFQNTTEIYRAAAEEIFELYTSGEKAGYEKAKKEFTRKTNAYVEGAGNLIPPKSKKDEEAEAIANNDVDAFLMQKAANTIAKMRKM